MTTQWTTKTLPSDGVPLAEQFAVLLLQGKNNFGDMIYSYLKVHVPKIQSLKEAIRAGKGFTPSDFGEVIAAGKGEPPPALRAEIASMYQVIDDATGSQPDTTAAPIEKKAWDEY